MNNILLILNIVFVTIIFMFLRDIIKKRLKIIVSEKFQLQKLRKNFELFNLVEWIKTLKEIGILDARKWIIYIVIIGSIYAFGNFKGAQGKLVEFNLDYEKEFTMQVDTNLYLHKPKNSKNLEMINEKGKRIKTIRVKDISELNKKLRPIGFIFEPVGVMGFGVGGYRNSGFEVGAGVSFIKYWQWRLETFATNRGVYLGTSYKLSKFNMNNSYVGFGVGKGYYGDSRGLVYYKWVF